ncbi:heat-inducible transcriptional repressor HrcA [Cocleimonas flava]|uniref:Heat-inducible transcription repressor HrcA n=1 Tax=Cocleimonas flava TaxID=634765 RepID=A0A4R1EPF0_9GAMM|nr:MULTISPECIES: heat-inducible transcriptional repressor HrcA [Cocleimonas]MEB8432428.1 heat-inducible transcriptional repressor HrcA [Cocleimonas sp. KMM 6892]MEC4715287.1 heat-inducible transcriptional repressor HrcA [Cocleimonas sp. KMM 6895]MEC4745094.1 heat-inducible transcriptional repressor HrcA [Cocleimonas sp. KMM 6896]TCJ82863.1 heat-inducible transcription repressor HrcA [Cocleimonas flava]
MSKDTCDLNERAKHLLKVLIEGYISDGQPIGSTLLAKRSGLDLSPATIRNVMASLEDAGYIHAPHTSAGRVPTSQGYRLFVDSLLNVTPLAEQECQTLQIQLDNRSSANLIQSASTMLSGLTQLTGIVMAPQMEARAIRKIEFLKLSDSQVLVVLVMSNNDIENRMITMDREITSSELQQSSNYLNEILVGKDLAQARVALLNEMKQVRADMNAMMLSAIDLGEQAVSGMADNVEDDYVVAGQTNLMDYDDLSDVTKLRQLFNAFNEKRDILNLLDRCMTADGVQIFIGRESGHEVFGDCSVVTAPYQIDDTHIGVLGVIGPKRMHYDRVIPVVDITAKLLSAALNK